MPITVTHKDLIENALAEVETLSIDEAATELGNDEVIFVDLRDPRELSREGKIPGALHAPRGMLEFWVDPTSPYFKEVFGEPKKFVFYCQSGWRSALATKAVQDMGMDNVSHIGDGFRGWKDAGLDTEVVEDKRR
jgi:rhodanese-related sulfurtransferase